MAPAPQTSAHETILLDVGNSATKLARITTDAPGGIETGDLFPDWTTAVRSGTWPEVGGAVRTEPTRSDDASGHPPSPRRSWWISSVVPATTARIERTVRATFPNDELHVVQRRDVPLPLELDEPDRVGIDRVLATFALADALADQPAASRQRHVVVTIGTAITVNRITEQGVFDGGAILPGMGLSLSALAGGTAALPRLDEQAVPTVALPGRNTTDAIRAGVFIGLAGAIDRLAGDLLAPPDDQPAPPPGVAKSPSATDTTSGSEPPGRPSRPQLPPVILTGGDATWLTGRLRTPHLVVPHLVLIGLARLAERRR